MGNLKKKKKDHLYSSYKRTKVCAFVNGLKGHYTHTIVEDQTPPNSLSMINEITKHKFYRIILSILSKTIPNTM